MEKTIMTATAYEINITWIEEYMDHLRHEERSENTIKKYIHDMRMFLEFLDGRNVDKGVTRAWKESLQRRYATSSVNSMLAAVNHFFEWQGWLDCKVKFIKTQRQLFEKQERELSQEEYVRLVKTAENQNHRLSMVIQTICATGIRVSELPFITVESVAKGSALVDCKGKQRQVFLPSRLCGMLKTYISQEQIKRGSIFLTKTGNPLDRSNIWREMKKLCENAGVDSEKVFPHNLRHLFARTYYELEKDISRLADLLGHSSINTTRIYTLESGKQHVKQLERMKLVVTGI